MTHDSRSADSIELTEHTTTHANGKSQLLAFPSSAMILLVVWSANGDGQQYLLRRQVPKTILTDGIVRRCAKGIDLLNEESISGARSDRASER